MQLPFISLGRRVDYFTCTQLFGNFQVVVYPLHHRRPASAAAAGKKDMWEGGVKSGRRY